MEVKANVSVEQFKTAPSELKRYYHTCVVYKETLYLWGGKNEKGNTQGDLWVKKGGDWKLQETKNSPSPRFGHVAAVKNNKMVIFGGCDSKKYLNEVHVLNLDKFEWENVKTSGTSPQERAFSSAVDYKDSLWVYGGYAKRDDSLPVYYGDFFQLNLDNYTWSTVECSGETPDKRRGHTVAMGPNDNLILYGGEILDNYPKEVYSFDFNEKKWKELEGSGLAGFQDHTLTLVDNKANTYFVYGGSESNYHGSEESVYDDSYLLTIDDNKTHWTKIKRGDFPRKGHTATMLNEELWIVGGKNEDTCAPVSCYKVKVEKIELKSPPKKSKIDLSPKNKDDSDKEDEKNKTKKNDLKKESKKEKKDSDSESEEDKKKLKDSGNDKKKKSDSDSDSNSDSDSDSDKSGSESKEEKPKKNRKKKTSQSLSPMKIRDKSPLEHEKTMKGLLDETKKKGKKRRLNTLERTALEGAKFALKKTKR